MIKNTIPFTKKGYEDLKKEYDEVLSTRKEAIKTLTRAREMGDLSENGFYKAAKANLFSIYSKLRHLSGLIKSAEVVETPSEGVVGIGGKILVNDGKKNRTFYIVGKFEANPLEDKISNESPIGKELIGKKVGNSIKIKTPMGESNYSILKIG